MTEPPPGVDDAGPPRIRPFLGGSPEISSVQPQSPAGPLLEPTALRPYVVTGGRVQAVDPSLGVETQVTVRGDRSMAGLPPELAAIVALCTEPVSIAEISARLRMHLGVTRVLVGDLRAAGLINVYTQDVTKPHSPEIIMRVMRGLRAIS
jgi:hypothetical protein